MRFKKYQQMLQIGKLEIFIVILQSNNSKSCMRTAPYQLSQSACSLWKQNVFFQ